MMLKANKGNLGNRTSLNARVESGFTLLELIIVIIILGVMAVGITGFITLTTQTYLNVTERDELLANARFVVERLNREIRDAVPNSVRVMNNNSEQCIEFVPILASTTYIDIPVAPDIARDEITAIPFSDKNGNAYECSSCNDQVLVYPLSPDEVYDNHNNLSGKVFNIDTFASPAPNQWTMPIKNGDVIFQDDSPTQRLYVANQQVSYCVRFGQVFRYSNPLGGAQTLPPNGTGILMADYLAPIDEDALPFTVLQPTLTRNAVVQVNLHFIQNDDDYIFNNDIHIHNTP